MSTPQVKNTERLISKQTIEIGDFTYPPGVALFP